MKLVVLMSMVSCLMLAAINARAAGAPEGAAPAIDAKSAASIGGYAIGANIGKDFKAQGLNIDLDALLQGIRDALQGAPPKYTEPQQKAAFEFLQQAMQAQQAQSGDKNKQAGEAFLTQNKAKPGVVSQPSGLQYQVLKAGNGPSPKATDTVKVHYEGTLMDGTVFDSSIKRNEPITFPVNGVIPGWTEALKLMKVGDKWRLFIPSDLAYGPQGRSPVIPPNSLLIFEVELLGIEAAQGK